MNVSPEDYMAVWEAVINVRTEHDKIRHQFQRFGTAEMRKRVKAGEYKLTNLN